jgi:pimeloyl-ACP methyl ester carboxylesterase
MAFFRTVLVGSLALLLNACSSDDDPAPTTTPPPGNNPGGTPDRPPLSNDVALPIVFVHGFAGSAQQYESQAIRFAMNGYPRERIQALDHDGAGMEYATYVALVDELVDQVRDQFNTDKVYLVGHSRGTAVSSRYLFDATRRAKVAKYISLDGFGCNLVDPTTNAASPLPAELPCLAPSQNILEGQAHVEVATSKDSFAMQYKFLVGTDPEVVDIVVQEKPIEISGRLVNFPANTGRAGSTLEIYQINSDTGHREGAALKTFSIDDTGNWGPVNVSPTKNYEMAMISDTGIQHFYPQKFLRSSHLVRLLSGPPDSPIRLATNRGPNHSAVIAMRMREWYTDPNPAPMGGRARDPNTMDAFEISTKSAGKDQAAVNIIAPRMTNADIAIHIHDDTTTPGESTLGALAKFLEPSCLLCTAFQTTADVFMPATDPPNGTITFKNAPRGDSGQPQVLNVPNWASSGHLISLMFSDYPQ